MRTHRITRITLAIALTLTVGPVARAGQQAAMADAEREIQKKDLPVAALAALEKLAGGATIREFAEEIEHGQKFYEGSWSGTHGNTDALVTESGAFVELEESLPAELVPEAVRAAAAARAGGDVELTYEKKTLVLYEVHFHRHGRHHELVLTPEGRVNQEENSGREGDERDEE